MLNNVSIFGGQAFAYQDTIETIQLITLIFQCIL